MVEPVVIKVFSPLRWRSSGQSFDGQERSAFALRGSGCTGSFQIRAALRPEIGFTLGGFPRAHLARVLLAVDFAPHTAALDLGILATHPRGLFFDSRFHRFSARTPSNP